MRRRRRGSDPQAATKACDAIYAAGGQPSVYKQLDGYGGVVCDYLWFVQALLNHASTVQPSAQLSSMHKIGTSVPYPLRTDQLLDSPSGSGVRRAWRAIYYHASCKCWQVPDPTFNNLGVSESATPVEVPVNAGGIFAAHCDEDCQ